MTLDTLNLWLNKNIDKNLKNHHIITDFYKTIIKYLNDKDINIINEESFKYEVYNYFYKNSVH